jgi:outer membrane protein assembly factor BamD
MLPKLTRPVLLLLACAVVIPAAGCARNKTSADTAYIARDVNTLYALAKERRDKQRYPEAAAIFDEVERQHPYSVWARRAQMMSAFSYYMAQKYPEAISSDQRFLTIHPGNKDAPYAHYLIAMSHYQQIEDVTRDQASTQLAPNSFCQRMRRYP